jgi:hypothetical protein
MDGQRIREYWGKEVEALVNTYKQFELLIPSEKTEGSAHRGEDGRYVEELIRQYLKRFLPTSIEVLTGFILRPAVKTGIEGKERDGESDAHSSQLDIIVYDSGMYPIFQRFGDSVIVPPEGVLAIISVKKHLNDPDIKNECAALVEASKLCVTKGQNKQYLRGPFLSVISVKSNINKKLVDSSEWIFSELIKTYDLDPKPYFDQLIGYIGSLGEWSIFKTRPRKNKNYAKYLYFQHTDEETHLGLQFILTGILSVFYDPTRNSVSRPGFTAFLERKGDKVLGNIEVSGLRNYGD